jgi:hypothetical protein
MKSIIKSIIPPVFISSYIKLFPQKQKSGMWSGNYASWKEAKANCTGYDADNI